MGLITQEVEITILKRNILYYKKCGFENISENSIIRMNVYDLPKNSSKYVLYHYQT